MKKIILATTLLITAHAANANNTLNGASRFVDLKLGFTSIVGNAAVDINEHNYSVGVERTHMFTALSDDYNIYFGVNGGLEIHANSFYRFEDSSTTLDFTTYSTHLAPALYFSPTERTKLFATLGVSYNILRTASDKGVLPINVKGSGFGYIASLGGAYSISDNFDIGIQYQVNAAKLKYDEIIEDMSHTERNRISDEYTFSSVYISAGYKF